VNAGQVVRPAGVTPTKVAADMKGAKAENEAEVKPQGSWAGCGWGLRFARPHPADCRDVDASRI